MLASRNARGDPESVATGAGSFKRMLGSMRLGTEIARTEVSLASTDDPELIPVA